MDPVTIVTVADAAIQGIQEAIAAWPAIKAAVSGGRDPTADEQALIDKAVDAAHAALQAL